MQSERGGSAAEASADRGPISAVVLAGGRSRRLGRDKAIEPVGGVPLVRRVIGAVGAVASEVLVVVAEPEQAAGMPLPRSARVVRDLYPDSGSLGGIYTGLSAAGGPWALVVACDMPFLSPDLLSAMARERDGCDAVVPLIEDRPEPTHALYSRRCLAPMRGNLDAGVLKIAAFYDSVRVKYLPQRAAEDVDPGLWSFFNVNTARDLQTAVARAAETEGEPAPCG